MGDRVFAVQSPRKNASSSWQGTSSASTNKSRETDQRHDEPSSSALINQIDKKKLVENCSAEGKGEGKGEEILNDEKKEEIIYDEQKEEAIIRSLENLLFPVFQREYEKFRTTKSSTELKPKKKKS